ncbi:MAG: RnfABCDGE type electron transport complex subunit B [Clostridia bacterium]|nr:RnfABCDGE type electron transport complex subunit B [Clostridia bacterium]
MQTILLPVLVLGGLGALFGGLLGIAAKTFKVETDERGEKIEAFLPGANCGGCGFSGCSAMAKALLKEEAPLTACSVLKEENAAEIASVLGIEPPTAQARVATVLCSGTQECLGAANHYDGISDCRAAARYGGEKACLYGCLGYGSCVKACSFGAISVIDGVAQVDAEICTGCGACLAACPRELIVLLSKSKRTFVACRSQEKGRVTKEICTAGCIGCGICEKNCPAGAITTMNHVASISYELCQNCGICADKCPKKVIQHIM